MSAGEVSHHDLPVGLALSQVLRDPRFLLLPERREPTGASINGLGAISSCARGGRLVVLSAAHVVVGVLLRWHCIDEVGVQEVIVHVKVQVSIDDGGLVVGCRHDPSVAGPSVGDLLIPAVVKLEASPVMVSQHAEPRLVGETSSLVDALEDLVKLVLGREGDLIHGASARLLDAAPVEVVADVEDVLRIHKCSTGLEGVGNQLLRLVVHACHVAAASGAGRLASGVEALHELLMVAKPLGVRLVPPAPWEHAGPRSSAPVVGDNGFPALWWVK